jgi:GH15 family glucan-1,4-alpha-glucosidase
LCGAVLGAHLLHVAGRPSHAHNVGCDAAAVGERRSDRQQYRYNIEDAVDGLSGEEGTFYICTFLLVEALTRAGRHDRSRLEEARLIFERMLANHVGLYAEETGHRGEALGNFPQAFTHLALISAAFNLDLALGPGR